MKTRMLLAALFVALTTMGFDCINSPIVASVSLSPISGCWHVTAGSGQFNDETDSLVIRNFLNSTYKDKLTGLRISNIVIRATPGYPNGNVTGDVSFGLDTLHANQPLLHFGGPYASFANGVSLLNPGTLIQYSPAGLQALVGALNVSTPDSLPRTIVLKGVGSGPPVAEPSFDVCCEITFQADASVN